MGFLQGNLIEFPLPQHFDPQKLLTDLDTADTFHFSAHPLQHHDGSWSVINLIYAGGKQDYAHEGTFGYGTEEPQATEVLAHCPYFREVLAAFPTKVKMARLSALPPGGRILRHHDPIESIDFGVLRVHVPIRNDPRQVAFKLGFKRRYWQCGQAYYGDFTFPHSVHNTANFNRVNLIADLEMNDAMLAFFPPGYMSEKTKYWRAWLRTQERNISWHLGRWENRLHLRGAAAKDPGY